MSTSLQHYNNDAMHCLSNWEMAKACISESQMSSKASVGLDSSSPTDADGSSLCPSFISKGGYWRVVRV